MRQHRCRLPLLTLVCTAGAAAQPPQWFDCGITPTIDGGVVAATEWDPDGPGGTRPLLVVAGSFTVIGRQELRGVAAWTGERWLPLGDGLRGVRLLASRDELLYAAGVDEAWQPFAALWNGSTWVPATTPLAEALVAETYRGQLYIAGSPNQQTPAAPTLYRSTDGNAWQSLPVTDTVRDLARHGADLAIASDSPPRVLWWNGTAISAAAALPYGNAPSALAVHRGHLIVGTAYAQDFVLRRNLTGWDVLGTGMVSTHAGDAVWDLAVHRGELFAAGSIRIPDVAIGVMRHTDASWEGIGWTYPNFMGVRLETFRDLLIVYGGFPGLSAAPGSSNLAAWDGANWRSLLQGEAFSGGAQALGWVGGALWVKGVGPESTSVGRLRNDVWEPVDLPAGLDAHVAVQFGTRVAVGCNPRKQAPVVALQGAAGWELIAIGQNDLNVYLSSLVVHENRLTAAGRFQLPDGVAEIVQWNGQQWLRLGEPSFQGRQLRVINGDLYAGGQQLLFGTSRPVVARLDPQGWTPLGSFEAGWVFSIFELDGAVAAHVRRGGTTGGSGAILRWNGASWAQVGPSFSPNVVAAAAEGSNLYVGGHDALLQFDGERWQPTPLQGPSGYAVVRSLVATDAGSLFAAGSFLRVGSTFAPHVAELRIAQAGCYPNCDASKAHPFLNANDFTCFLQRFAAGDSYANCNNSTTAPTLNVADFTCFLQRFAAGCP